MRMSRTIVSTMVIQTLWLLAGCCTTEHTFMYRFTGLELAHLDNRGSSLVESSDTSLSARAYGIRVKLARRDTTIAGLGLLPAAYATSCAELFTYINQDTVLTLRIHTLTADSAVAPHDVTDDFRVMTETYPNAPNKTFQSIPELVQKLNEHQPEPTRSIDLIRTGSFDRSDTIRFVVTMELSGGTVLADTTSPTILL